MSDEYTFNCFLCGRGGCTEAHADTPPEGVPADVEKIYICDDCREFAEMAQTFIDAGIPWDEWGEQVQK